MHRWLGLSAGLVLVVSGISGSALVFRQEIDAAQRPELLRVVPAATRTPLQPILDEARRRWPAAPPSRVRVPRTRDGTYELWMGDAPERYVYADPYRGTLLGTRRPNDSLEGWLFSLHTHLFAGEIGGMVLGGSALALALLSLTGMLVWWPRRAPWRAWSRWRAALTVRRDAGARRVEYDLHRVTGFYTAAALFVAGLSGASLAFPRAFERAAHWITRSSPALASAAPHFVGRTGRPSLSADSLLAIAERAQPGGKVSYVYLASARGQPFRVRKRLPGEVHPNGRSFVTIDPVTGGVLAVEDGTRAPRGGRLYALLYPLHTGAIGGTPTRLIALFAGLMLPLLAATGGLQWWRRSRQAR